MTNVLQQASSQLEIILKYEGVAVDDGTMPIGDVISALRGFSNAYGKVASNKDPSGHHQIRVAAISKSSFAVKIMAWASQNPGALLTISGPIAVAIIGLIIKLIELKKATRGKEPASIQVNGSNNTVIVTTSGDNTTIEIPREVYEVYKSKDLDGELSKIVAPLEEGAIDAVSISAKDQDTVLDPVVITSSEKAFFSSDSATTTTSKPIEIDGAFVSLNKDINRGRFRMQNGTTVPYHFLGENPAAMHADFAYKGPTRIECVATFDNNLELKSLDVTRVTRLQRDLSFE